MTNTQASASPITDGEHIIAFFGSRGLHCLDMQGKLVWSKDLGKMQTRNEFGEGASPALHEDTIVVVWDHEGEDFIVIRSMVYLSLSHDHRVIDGLLGGKFLSDVIRHLESFNEQTAL